jgi:hypothetical protein
MTHICKEGLYNIVHWAACLVSVYTCTLCDKPLFVHPYCLVAMNLSGLLILSDTHLTYDAFIKELNHFSGFYRPHLLLNIPKLAPAIIHLSDRSTLSLVVQAMREVCQQWP